MTPHTLSCLRLLDTSRFVSGATMASSLGVSRASVSLALAEVEALGIALERRHGVGYRLLTPLEWLDAAAISAQLSRHSALQVDVAEVTDSTNRQLLNHPQHGKVLAAEWQSGGRGRRGRAWQAPLGGALLFSLCWQFPGSVASLGGLSLAVGATLASVLTASGAGEVQLKWPNDLVVAADGAYAKLGGILIEIAGDAMGPVQAVIGIGLNLATPQVADGLQAIGVRHLGCHQERNALLANLLSSLEDALTRYARDGFAPFREPWQALHAWHGRRVDVHTAQGVLEGVACGVAEDGALLVQRPGGQIAVHSGDVTLRLVAQS
ncbi:biotin--[acetyl-CoA-carboxylase] ligase [Chitinibacteraceae bacterium HSL-7]